MSIEEILTLGFIELQRGTGSVIMPQWVTYLYIVGAFIWFSILAGIAISGDGFNTFFSIILLVFGTTLLFFGSILVLAYPVIALLVALWIYSICFLVGKVKGRIGCK